VLLHRLEEHELHVQGLEVGDCPLPPATCASRLCLDELCSHTSTSRAQDAATLSKSLVKDLQNKLRAAQVGDTARSILMARSILPQYTRLTNSCKLLPSACTPTNACHAGNQDTIQAQKALIASLNPDSGGAEGGQSCPAGKEPPPAQDRQHPAAARTSAVVSAAKRAVTSSASGVGSGEGRYETTVQARTRVGHQTWLLLSVSWCAHRLHSLLVEKATLAEAFGWVAGSARMDAVWLLLRLDTVTASR